MTDALPASVRATLEQLATRYAHDNPVWQLIADLLAQQGQRPEQQPPLAAQETAGWQPIDSDSVKFLRLLLTRCDTGPTEHEWRKCQRCLALREVEDYQPVAYRLIMHAIHRLEALLPSPPAAQEGTD